MFDFFSVHRIRISDFFILSKTLCASPANICLSSCEIIKATNEITTSDHMTIIKTWQSWFRQFSRRGPFWPQRVFGTKTRNLLTFNSRESCNFLDPWDLETNWSKFCQSIQYLQSRTNQFDWHNNEKHKVLRRKEKEVLWLRSAGGLRKHVCILACVF